MKKLYFLFPFNHRCSCGRLQKHRAYGSPHHPRWCCGPSLPEVHSGCPHSFPWPSPRLLSLPAALLLYARLSQQFPLIFCYLSMFSLLGVFPNFFLSQVPDLSIIWPLKEINIHMVRHSGLSKGLLMISQLQISWHILDVYLVQRFLGFSELKSRRDPFSWALFISPFTHSHVEIVITNTIII